MKNYLILFLFLISCSTSTYNSTYKTGNRSATIINADLQIDVKLTYGTPSGCKANLTVLNKTSKSFNSVYVEVTIFDERGVNIDMLNFSVGVNPRETVIRDRTFYKYNCYDTNDVKITKTSYR